jgi:hypothetical protein
MPNRTETYEQDEQQQRNIKQGNQPGEQRDQNREANQQNFDEREAEHTDDLDDDDTDELSTADQGDDADLAGGEEQVGDVDDEESIEHSADEANENAVGGDNLDESVERQAGQRTNDGRRQADDIDIERDTRKDDDIEEE